MGTIRPHFHSVGIVPYVIIALYSFWRHSMIRTLAYFKCSLVIPSSPGALRTLSETSVSLYLPLLYYNLEFCPMPCIGL